MNVYPIPAFADNYIWAISNETTAALVDPGDAAPALAWLAQRALSLSAILITHHHPDHVGGVEELRRRYPDAPVYGPARETIPQRTHALREGDAVSLPALGLTFAVWEIPGHTAGHIAYVHDAMAFVGDTMFAAGCGRIFDGTAAQLHASLARIAGLPDTVDIYCTHEYTLSNLRFALAVEPDNDALIARSFSDQAQREAQQATVPFRVDAERATNPFLRAHVPAVRERAQLHAGAELHTPLEVFRVLREWKNSFR